MKNITYLALLAALLLLVGSRSVFVVDQAEQAIIVQLGEPIEGVITEPGLHWRLPFIQDVRRFDNRLLDWDGDVSQIPTLGREFIIVDTTARWRITNPLQFLRSVRDEAGARTRLDDVLDSAARDIVSGTEVEKIVRSADWRSTYRGSARRTRLRSKPTPAAEEGPRPARKECCSRPRRCRCPTSASSRRRTNQADQLHRVGRPAGREPDDQARASRHGSLGRRRPQPGDPGQHGARAPAHRVGSGAHGRGRPRPLDAEATKIWRAWSGSGVLRFLAHARELLGIGEHHADDRREVGLLHSPVDVDPLITPAGPPRASRWASSGSR